LLEKHQDTGKIPVGCDLELGRNAARLTISSLAPAPQGCCKLAAFSQGNLAGIRRKINTGKAIFLKKKAARRPPVMQSKV
jgi:hypothetical protein